MTTQGRIVLGSKSPRRRELLGQIVAAERIEVLPPRSPDEPGFVGLSTWSAIERRLEEIVAGKLADVSEQLAPRSDGSAPVEAIVAADTVIVATEPGDPSSAGVAPLVVLGQPPAEGDWKQTVRHWFRHYYAGRAHVAATAVCVRAASGQTSMQLVKTVVGFHPDVERWLEWYLETGEPLGKAGGYGLQGAGGMFVARVQGSLSNVVGLPLREVLELFDELGIGH